MTAHASRVMSSTQSGGVLALGNLLFLTLNFYFSIGIRCTLSYTWVW